MDNGSNGMQLTRRERVQLSVADVFAEKGFEGSSVRSIARAIGITPATFYHYYSSKEEALREICEIGASYSWNALAEAREHQGLIDEKLHTLFAHHLDNLRRHESYMRTYLSNWRLVPDGANASLQSWWLDFGKTLTAMVSEAIDRGEITNTANANHIAIIVIAVMKQITDHYLMNRETDLDEFVREAPRLLVKTSLPG